MPFFRIFSGKSGVFLNMRFDLHEWDIRKEKIVAVPIWFVFIMMQEISGNKTVDRKILEKYNV